MAQGGGGATTIWKKIRALGAEINSKRTDGRRTTDDGQFSISWALLTYVTCYVCANVFLSLTQSKNLQDNRKWNRIMFAGYFKLSFPQCVQEDALNVSLCYGWLLWSLLATWQVRITNTANGMPSRPLRNNEATFSQKDFSCDSSERNWDDIVYVGDGGCRTGVRLMRAHQRQRYRQKPGFRIKPGSLRK